MSGKTFMLTAVIVAIIVCVAAIVFFLNSKSAEASCDTVVPRPTIVAFGDSLVEGYGAPRGGDFVTKLSTRIGVPIQNFGRSGDTTADGLARVKEVEGRADIAILLLGGNDALRKTPIAQTKQNLGQLIERLQAGGKTDVVLIGVLGGFPSDPYAPMFKELAKEHRVTYVPNILSGLIANTKYMSDQVHPNEAGYERIAERLAPILSRVCSSL
jgi:acyl-CoA thioesterase-1